MRIKLPYIAFLATFFLLIACSDKHRGTMIFNSNTERIEDNRECNLKQIIESSDSTIIFMQHAFESRPIGDSLRYFLNQKNGWKLSLSIPCFSGQKVNSKILQSFFYPKVFLGKPSHVLFNTFAHELDLSTWLTYNKENAKSSLLWSVSFELEGFDKFLPVFDIQNGTIVNFVIIEKHSTNNH